MKHLYIIALCIVFSASTYAQTNLRSVMVNSNGVVVRPTNFWQANSQESEAAAPYSIFNVTMANLTMQEEDNANVEVTNSRIALNVVGTNASSQAGVRMMVDVNARPPGGVGTAWANNSHELWTIVDAVVRTNGRFRVVVGNSTTGANIASYPTNRAVGYEIDVSSNDSIRVRVIAHNGASATNGPWVALGNVFNRYTIGVLQNKTNGQVQLSTGMNEQAPTIKTNATIGGGPTNNAAIGLSSFEAGIYQSGTNDAGCFAGIYSAWVKVVP